MGSAIAFDGTCVGKMAGVEGWLCSAFHSGGLLKAAKNQGHWDVSPFTYGPFSDAH